MSARFLSYPSQDISTKFPRRKGDAKNPDFAAGRFRGHVLINLSSVWQDLLQGFANFLRLEAEGPSGALEGNSSVAADDVEPVGPALRRFEKSSAGFAF